MSRRARAGRGTPREVRITVSVDELRTLALVADYYKRSMGPLRHVVRLTASAEVRGKYRFISEESLWLKRFIESVLPVDGGDSTAQIEVDFASRAVIAFWGRVLSSLHSKRARRRMKPVDLALREGLNQKLRDAARRLQAQDAGCLDADLLTRRPAEVGWMHAELNGNPEDTKQTIADPASPSA